MSKPKPLPALERLNELFLYYADIGELSWKVSRQGVKNDRYAGCIKHGYRQIHIDYQLCLAHRIIWKMVTGQEPPALLDHINGVTSDNRFGNLREATPLQNTHNRRMQKRNATGLKGVAKGSARTWRAMICMQGKTIYLGSYKTPELAHEAYWKKAQQIHGEYARQQ